MLTPLSSAASTRASSTPPLSVRSPHRSSSSARPTSVANIGCSLPCDALVACRSPTAARVSAAVFSAILHAPSRDGSGPTRDVLGGHPHDGIVEPTVAVAELFDVHQVLFARQQGPAADRGAL